MSDITSTLYKALAVANDLIDSAGLSNAQSIPISPKTNPSFVPPAPITPSLKALGLSAETSAHLSTIYLHRAEQLKTSLEEGVHKACARLATFQQGTALDKLQRGVFETFYHIYKSTLLEWSQELTDIARSCPTSTIGYKLESPVEDVVQRPTKRSKRQFKTEYLPLFEFAFEQDRFPSREDKKQLARISGMSYRQVNVWFQNRRCRQPSRSKSYRTASVPKTFEEMKARLDPSTRVALLESTPLTKKLNPDLADPSVGGLPVLMQNSLPSMHAHKVIVLDDDDVTSPVVNTPCVSSDAGDAGTTLDSTARSAPAESAEATMIPGSATRAVSLGATDDGFASDERDDSSDDDFLAASMPQRSEIVDRAPSPQKQNPLNRFRAPVHAFPTPYGPSQLTSNPFIIEHHPWLRDPRTNSQKFINPAPEAMEEIMDGFDHMDVDDPDATVNSTHEQLNNSPRQRIISARSLVTWSSEESTVASRTSSYSLSVRSSPRFSDSELPSPTESISFKTAEYKSPPVFGKSFFPGFEAETAEDDTTAGPSAAPLDEATPSEPSIPKDIPSVDLKWEALLASAT